MAQKKELRNLYLAVEGLDEKGGPATKISEEEAKKHFEQMLLSNLSKCFAQMEVAKELGWLDDNRIELIERSAKDPDNQQPANKRERKAYYIAEVKKNIDKVLEQAKRSKRFYSDSDSGLL